MATHDAYAWLAGARGVGLGTGAPLARVVEVVSGVTGAEPESVGFWAPAVAGGLVSVVAALWALALGAPEAALCAGMLSSLASGYFLRSRLGYYDTDMATLLFPLAHCLLLAVWLSPWLRSPLTILTRRPDSDPDSEPPGPGWPFGIGATAVLLGGQWHHDIPNAYAVSFIISAGLVVLLGYPRYRTRLMLGLCIYGLAALHGMIGLALAAGLSVALLMRPQWELLATRRSALVAGFLLAVLVLAPPVLGLGGSVASKVQLYAKASAVDLWDASQREADGAQNASAPVYPDVVQSIIEAGNVTPSETIERMGVSTWAAVAGLAGFAVLVIVRPSALFLLPLAILSFFAMKFGSRFSMFGGPVVAIGLAVPLALWLAHGGGVRRRVLAGVVTTGIGLAALIPAVSGYADIPVASVLRPQHAQALERLEETPRHSVIWTWWDYGYATMFYGGRWTFADGARHTGRFLYPLARVLATPSPMQAAQIMRYSAIFRGEPWDKWDRMSAEDVRDFVDSLATQEIVPPIPVPRYLVVAWENLALASWITYFGSWDPVAGTGRHALCRMLRGDFSVDFETGILTMDGSSVRLATVDELTGEGRDYHSYGGGRLHLVINEPASQAFVMDDAAYHSMLVQLLITPPGEKGLEGSFRLVHEGFPFVRIYEGL
nr:STT3 domain-containing protein [Desulfobaculum xiamenense]